MVASEDDPRSIDWAPTKIKALEDQVGRISENLITKIDGLTDRVFDLERRREEADRRTEQRDRITGLQLNRAGNDEDLAEQVRALQETVDGFELAERVLQLEKAMADHTSETVKAVWSETVRQLDEEGPWNLGPGEIVNPEEFSPPIGRSPETILDNHRRSFDMKLSPENLSVAFGGSSFDPRYPVKTDAERHGGLFSAKYPGESGVISTEIQEAIMERGWTLGHAAAVDEAESRMVAALDKIDLYGRHRDEILSALRGR